MDISRNDYCLRDILLSQYLEMQEHNDRRMLMIVAISSNDTSTDGNDRDTGNDSVEDNSDDCGKLW